MSETDRARPRLRAAVGRVRILLVEPDLFDNGAVRVSLDRARHWQDSGHDVTVLVMHAYASDAERVRTPSGLAVHLASSRPRRPAVEHAHGVAAVLSAARAADVAVAGREIGDGLLQGALAASVLRKPLAVTVHAGIDRALDSHVAPRLRGLTLRALRSADLAVCVAGRLVPPLQAVGVPASRTRVVENGIDVAHVLRAAEQEPVVPRRGRPVVVTSGRLIRQKGLDVLVRAHAAALAGGAPEHDLVVMGTGPDRDELEQLAGQLGVSDSVRLVGFVANPHAVVSRSDLFVLASRWEGYPLALVEALALGVPSIAADCVSGPRELLEDDRYGELVPVEDAQALADAITRHLADPTPLRERARAAQAVAAQRHDPRSAADAHLQELRRLVDRQASPRSR